MQFLLLISLTLVSAVASADVFLCGNRFTDPQLTLQDGSISVDGYLAWPLPPPDGYASAERHKVELKAVTTRQEILGELSRIKRTGRLTPDVVARVYDASPLTDSAVVRGDHVMVYWTGAFAEEINASASPVEPTEVNLTEATYQMWDKVLRDGGEIYLGWDKDNGRSYYRLVPRSQVGHHLNEKGNRSSKAIRDDLDHPVPLSKLRRR